MKDYKDLIDILNWLSSEIGTPSLVIIGSLGGMLWKYLKALHESIKHSSLLLQSLLDYHQKAREEKEKEKEEKEKEKQFKELISRFKKETIDD